MITKGTLRFRNNQTGFTILEVLLILVVIGLLGLIGSFVWYRHFHSNPIIPTPPPMFIPPDGWVRYESTHSPIKFLYPSNWKLKPVSLSDKPGYYLEDVILTGPNNFEITYTLEKRHVRPNQYWSCTTPPIQTKLPVNSRYNMVLDGTVRASLLSTNQNNLLSDDFGCGTLINSITTDMQFKFIGNYSSGTPDQTTDAFVNRAEVQAAKEIFASLTP